MTRCHVALSFILTVFSVSHCAAATVDVTKQVFIVHVEGPAWPLAGRLNLTLRQSAAAKKAFLAARIASHDKFLEGVDARPSFKQYSYTHSMNGFAALLSDQQASSLRGLVGIVSVQPDQKRSIRTTYSSTFLGLNNVPESKPPGIYTKRNGTGMIIGMIDTGVWPEHPSFSDAGYPNPPQRFKGICEKGQNWTEKTCNRKIIGARYFSSGFERMFKKLGSWEFRSPRDSIGHGSHTSSTAAGSKVFNAGIGSVDMGTAQGVAYGAHISVYKVCFGLEEGGNACLDSDILKAIDQAIQDNVDVLSISISGGVPSDPLSSSIDYGTLMASIAGIPSAVAAGNRGPNLNSVENIAPWYLTVASNSLPRSTILIDYSYPTCNGQATKFVYLGNSIAINPTTFDGFGATNGTVRQGTTSPKLPLIYAKDAAIRGVSLDLARKCQAGTLNKTVVSGKIIVCDDGPCNPIEQGYNARMAGASGMILLSTRIGVMLEHKFHVLPAIHVSYDRALNILKYLAKEKKPVAAISSLMLRPGAGTSEVSYFSSRGPNPKRSIMKPDIVAPGEDIFAASKPYSLEDDSYETLLNRKPNFKFLSGTSMATPHVAGALLLLKSLKPKWSPGALQSALSTTAKPLSSGNSLDFGSGMMRPNFAVNPGLVYDSGVEDYSLHLCSYFQSLKVRRLLGEDCPGNFNDFDYNSPSLVMRNVRGQGFNTTRHVTNVGPSVITYQVSINQPKGALVKISPTMLKFTAGNKILKFTISVVGKTITNNDDTGDFALGRWSWISTDGKYRVESPILVQIKGLP